MRVIIFILRHVLSDRIYEINPRERFTSGKHMILAHNNCLF